MPVIKYKTFEDAERSLWCFNPDNEYYLRIEILFKTLAGLHKIEYPKGVHKYKTFDEAQNELNKWRIELNRL